MSALVAPPQSPRSLDPPVAPPLDFSAHRRNTMPGGTGGVRPAPPSRALSAIDEPKQPQVAGPSNASSKPFTSGQAQASDRPGRNPDSPPRGDDRDRSDSRERRNNGSGDGSGGSSGGKGGSGSASASGGGSGGGAAGGGDDSEQNRVYKAISRVHRACTSCRKQKARCEGPEHPPCRRCKAAGIDCIFEKPPRETGATAPDAGSERIKSLETQMSDMQAMMGELVNTLKTNTRLLAQQVQTGSPSPLRTPAHAPAQEGAQPPPQPPPPPGPVHPMTAYRSPTAFGPGPPRAYAPRTQDLLQQPTTAQHSQYLQQEGAGPGHAGTAAAGPGGAESPSAKSDMDRRIYPWSAPSPRLGSGLSSSVGAGAGAEQPSGAANWKSPGHVRSSPASNQLELQHRPGQPWHPAGTAEGSRGRDATSATSLTPDPPSQGPHQPWRPAMSQRTSMPPPPARRLFNKDADGDADISNEQLSAPIEALRGLADAAAAAADAGRGGADDDLDASTHTPSEATGSRRYPGDEFLVNKDTPNAASTVASGPHRRSQSRPLASEPSPADDASGGPLKRRRTDSGSVVGGDDAAGAGPSQYPDDINPHGIDRPGDLVTLGLVTEDEARRLFNIFGQGVPKFISIFHFEDVFFDDARSDAMESIRARSFFLFNTILAIGAMIECGGGPKNRLYRICMAQAKRNAKDTLFMPVDGKEAVQAMVLLGSYSDNGWLPTGMSIRMAQELGLDRSFQRLMTRLPPGSMLRQPPPPPHPPRNHVYHQGSPASLYTDSPGERSDVSGPVLRRDDGDGKAEPEQGSIEELRELARGARLWFFLFLFDHQASFGAGRPAMLSKHYVRNCRAFLTLQYPLAVDTDARFISTLELLIIRETHYDAMGPYDQPVDARMLARMRRVTHELDEWHKFWSNELSNRGYDESSFFQQSLVLQCASAELYLTCTALRGIKDAHDADRMGPEQKELIIQATRAADTCLSISVNSDEYREMLGWAPHYTHVTAAFACVFLIVDTYGIFSNAERLATRLAEVPATKYSRVIRILLAQAWKKITDLSPSIGLYAALGAEGSRPGAITPAEIKMGGPSDTGLALLYKLLAQHQQADNPSAMVEGADDPATAAAAGAAQASGSTDVGLSVLQPADAKWNTSTAPSPQIAATAMTPSRLAGMGLSYRGNQIEAESPRMPWSTDTPSGQPLQLPLWMQESTGSLMDSTNQLRDWVAAVDGYAGDAAFGTNGMGNITGPSGQSAMTPSGMANLQQQQQPAGGSMASNFDSVLSDLGLPIDGLDVLFFDHPTVASEAQQPVGATTSQPTPGQHTQPPPQQQQQQQPQQ
ncbi:uncharacterized protein PSFLO_03411 [Pseudozyma flocculosa]|uniref:Zn(2)-C6 fungal-type domain-containing protein n=1 Tax=Pseudozyma flocculosa TaxID=84751 RepID=A0A5C3F094_9BASI|nr:uncharacterized protein PSFLO_03411 [Pseudozyma flocculosa]